MLTTFSTRFSSASAKPFRTTSLQDADDKPSTIELLGPAALAGAALVGARLLNIVAQAMG